ncbi:hypothetical protein A9Q87_05575 [Flavobacteriales bacterium 34_180_T64]|nr:hypothetical protein A9Q87_05575 [Flavobacteriales bacterium 34_180_T64]
MKVFIDPSCDIQYSSFYIYGLYSVYGKNNVIFSSKYFKYFNHNNHFFAFVVVDREILKRIVLDYTDSKIIDQLALDWCDVYGKINLAPSSIKSDKIISIGPSFGIQIYSKIETLWFALSNLLKSSSRIKNKRKFLSDYKAQYKRPKLIDYKYKPNAKNFVFFIASLWKNEEQTNLFRANYIRGCRNNAKIDFKGGFAPRTKNDIQDYEEVTVNSRVDMDVYLSKIIDSAIVFNTPAVKGCHGWKLAEYLCLGKAIISTPLSRQLPKNLMDNEHVIYSNGSQEDISLKLDEIMSNIDLRKRLESNAKNYFDTYLSPEQVVKRVVNIS